MRRADRLFQIVHLLRGRRLTTARQLAEWLKVSERTIYRDVRDLGLSGVPIEGEAGVGYALRRGYDLPPLMFEYEEIEALVLGARWVEAWSSPALATSARSALAKIASILPEPRQRLLGSVRAYVPHQHIPAQLGDRFEAARTAIRRRMKLEFAYARAGREVSERVVRPLSLFFWGERWTLAAWCERRGDFRNFRLDRMLRIRISEQGFADEPGRGIDDFLKRMADDDS